MELWRGKDDFAGRIHQSSTKSRGPVHRMDESAKMEVAGESASYAKTALNWYVILKVFISHDGL